MNNPYLKQVYACLPKVLSLTDTDKTNFSYGMGDRFFWAWGLIDFGNSTFQGLAHGLSLLWKEGLWPYDTNKDLFVERVNSLFIGANKLMRNNGSLEEAFPNEGSYCVTALVAYDLLCALENMEHEITDSMRNNWLGIIKPAISFLLENDEKHGLISNHLATASAALYRWSIFTNSDAARCKADILLTRILQNQSSEGWYVEYQGADPGYQSLCMFYLADIYNKIPKEELLKSLELSCYFLQHFVHPDGSYGGTYGSRNTRFFCPGGFEKLYKKIPYAASLCHHMAESIDKHLVVTLDCIDEPNLSPWFNAYCRAASEFSDNRKVNIRPLKVQCELQEERKVFNDAGIFISNGKNHYTIINWHKGGTVVHFDQNTKVFEDCGVVFKNQKDRLASTQVYSKSNRVDIGNSYISIESEICEMTKKRPTPISFLILRIMCLSVFRLSVIREFVKLKLAKYLITRTKSWRINNYRTIEIGENLNITDVHTLPKGVQKIDGISSFISIHMASKGYWQVQDERKV